MKIYDEILKAIEHSNSMEDLHISYKMLRSTQDDLTKEDYQELEQLIIIKKEEEWK